MFVEQIEKLCEMKNEKISNVLKKIGIAPNNATRWKQGGDVTSSVIIKLADYFQVSTDYLLERTNEREAKNITYGNYSTSGDNSIVKNYKTDDLPYITLAIIQELKNIPEEEQADIFKIIKSRKKGEL